MKADMAANNHDSKLFKQARVRQGLSQQALAKMIGVPQPYISLWETGKSEPDAGELQKLADALGLEKTDGALSPATGSENGPSAFGIWQSATRLRKNVSVAQLASLSGVSGPALYAIENGKIKNPRKETQKRIAKALGETIPTDVVTETEIDSTVPGVGEFKDFDPYDLADRPKEPGIYVFYDISDRPIYVGEAQSIDKRVKAHEEKFWFKRPIVERASYVVIKDAELRRKIETVLIKFLKSNAVLNKQNVEWGD